MPLRSDDPRSPARQIVDEIRRQIALGELKPGAQLPSNAEMRNEYDVSNQTAQNAISALKNDNLVYSVPGRGVFVRSDFDHDELLKSVAGDDASSELYGDLLARLEKLGEAQSALSGEVADIRRRIEMIEQRHEAERLSSGQSPSVADH